MVSLNKEKINKKAQKGEKCMLQEKINKKRKELDESIENNDKYENVYKLSVELDDLIAEFYEETKKKKEKKFFKKKNEFNKILYIV